MEYSSYIGHVSQISGIEEHRLVGGKGDGMRLFEVRNGLGLECVIVPDRCSDIARLTFMGQNIGYFSPSGYVAPSYYDIEGEGFLKSFTGGFLTTCGLTAVGVPCVDNGERLPLHGTIANTPAEHIWWCREADMLSIQADIWDARIFSRKLKLNRKLEFSLKENTIRLTDAVTNYGDAVSPLMLMYHFNIGYPLLSERARLTIPSINVIPRDARAAEDIDTHLKITPPQSGFVEQCYYHKFGDTARCEIVNPDIGVGLSMAFDTEMLDHFCQWKMMGEHDYVLGLEPGNCTPDGRNVMRENGELKFIKPNESLQYRVDIRLFQCTE